MKTPLYLPESHLSHRNHRRQLWLQILLPFLITVVLVIAAAVLASLAAFSESGDSPRWAAISTIWLVIPWMGFGLLLLTLLTALVYLLARALQIIPSYSAKAQYYVRRAAGQIQRASDLAVQPVLFLEGMTASVKAFFGKK